MAKQEKKQEEIARKQAIDDANAIAAAKESSTEEADARKALAANEYSVGGMDAFNLSSGEKFKYNQIVANVNATREERLAAQEKINAENTFQQNQIGALAYFSEDKTELATLREKGNVYFDDKSLQGAYVRFLDGNPNVKLSGKRVGNDWVNTLTENGVTYELPTDKIKDGSFKAFALTPDLYEGIDAQAKEINAARNKREKGMQEFTPNDLSGIKEAVNVNIQKATANFSSYLEADPIKAKAILANTIYPNLKPDKIEEIFNGLTAGGEDGVKAFGVVAEELKKDIEYKWGMNTGVFRNDKDEFEVMKPEEPVNTKSSGGSTAKYAQDDNTLIANSLSLNPEKYPIENEETFYAAFASKYPVPQVYNGNEVIDLVSKPGGFVIKTKQLKDKATVKQVDRTDLDKQTTKLYPDKTFSELNQEELGKVRTAAEEANQMAAFMSNGSDEFEEIESPLFKYTNSTHMRKYMEATVAKGGNHSLNGIKTSAENIGTFYRNVSKQNKSE